tara:strand:- start:3267 stop:4394 length:1128 start_codon:yes stop_codon:yes gene_type:complete
MDDSKVSPAEKIIFIIGIILGFVTLYWISSSIKTNINFDELALGEETSSHFGKVENLYVHCSDKNDLDFCLDSYFKHGKKNDVTLWLGNSQLHAINKFKNGQETATIKLHKLAKKYNIYLISVSQPNANLQEHFLLTAHLIKKLPVKHIILPIVFDDMREDGIRFSLKYLFQDQKTINLIKDYEIGKKLLSQYENLNIDTNETKNLQDKSENYFDKKLSNVWSLWSERPQFRGDLFNFLYRLRNYVFQINPSTSRKILPGEYKKNFQALKSLIEISKKYKIKLIIYNVPIRNDVKIPYDHEEYNKFKKNLISLSNQNSFKFLNLEQIVPNNLWGKKASTTISKNKELDFMHFKEEGHEILAKSLYLEMLNFWSEN